jgi:uncharacterized protein YkwD
MFYMKTATLFYAIAIGITGLLFSACAHKMAPATNRADANNTRPAAQNNNTPNSADLQQDILLYVNQYRQSIGQPALLLLPAANQQAAKHSANMAHRLTAFGHTGFEARAAAISKSLGATVSAAAENVALGKLTAAQVVASWLQSPGHKKNISGNYSYTGIGYAADPGGILYFTQIFIQP